MDQSSYCLFGGSSNYPPFASYLLACAGLHFPPESRFQFFSCPEVALSTRFSPLGLLLRHHVSLEHLVILV